MSTSILPSAYHLSPPDGASRAAGQVASPLQRRQRRRRWRLASLLLAVAVPTAVAGVYLRFYAADQYETGFRFSVRHEAPLRMEPSAGSPLASPIAASSTPLAVITDSEIVVQYLKSRQVIEDMIAAGVDLDAIYAGSDRDFLSHLAPHSPLEERQRYWRAMVDPFFDMTTGIVSVNVRAFRPADARLVAGMALALSEKLVNDVANRAHADTLTYARAEASASETKLKAAQSAIAAYRNRYAVLFPEMQASADTTLEGRMEDRLIDAGTTYNAQVAQGTSKDTMQMRMLANRIAAMETALRGVHGQLAQPALAGATAPSLASVMSRYDVLHLDEAIAAKVYERALLSLQDARNAARQQGVYLAAFVRPGLPEESTYPVRWRVLLETALLSFVGWCLVQLLYHGIRDHLD